MQQTINNKIQRGFSGSAKRYDLYSSLHREIADKLLARVAQKGDTLKCPLFLLDVGCGTGYLTIKLKDHFPQCKIIGLDFAQGMLNTAASKRKDIAWVLADGNQLPFSDNSFDILVSNLAYQWAGDLSQAFTEVRRVLSHDGILACTLFGFHTCQELFQSLEEARPRALQFNRLPNEDQIRKALTLSGFEDPSVNSEQVRIAFKDMHDLVTWLRSIGANNLPREGYVGREAMARAAAIYRSRFAYHDGVQATFEVIRIYVKK